MISQVTRKLKTRAFALILRCFKPISKDSRKLNGLDVSRDADLRRLHGRINGQSVAAFCCRNRDGGIGAVQFVGIVSDFHFFQIERRVCAAD